MTAFAVGSVFAKQKLSITSYKIATRVQMGLPFFLACHLDLRFTRGLLGVFFRLKQFNVSTPNFLSVFQITATLLSPCPIQMDPLNARAMAARITSSFHCWMLPTFAGLLSINETRRRTSGRWRFTCINCIQGMNLGGMNLGVIMFSDWCRPCTQLRGGRQSIIGIS
jgi:hypothetical protein